MMTIREIFKKVKNHLLVQNAKSSENGSCVYRSSSGRSCAVGCLIEDEDYDPDFELRTFTYPPIVAALKKSGVNVRSAPVRKLLEELQWCHDQTDPENWPDKLREIANDYGIVEG